MRALRKDANQTEIVRALRAAGVRVFVLHVPCDLLCRRGDRLYLLDVEGITKNRKRDPKQLEAFAQFGVRLVKTTEAAFAAVELPLEV
jgi:putative NIF3 family GTP cyclohydrolase 1 type 2